MKSVLVIAGPSAVGKTSIAKLMINLALGYELVRSVTTRAPRGDEHDSEYIYLSREEFSRLKSQGGLLEDMEYGGELYGTPLGEIERMFTEGKTPLLILDMNGVKSLRARKLDFSVYSIYLYDDINVIENRLYSREIGDAPTIEGFESFIKRKNANLRDYISITENHKLFDCFFKNEALEMSAFEIDRIFKARSRFDNKEDIARMLTDSVRSK